MPFTIPDELIRPAGLTEQEVRIELAALLFHQERLTLAQASRLAGLSLLGFQRALRDRRIPLHYGEEELRQDLERVSGLDSR